MRSWQSSADITRVKLDGIQARIHINQVGSVVEFVTSALVVPWAPPSFPINKVLDEPGKKRERADPHAQDLPGAVGITAGGIVPGRSCARCEPNVESVEEDALRIIRVHDNSLIVPVLGIIACAVWQSLSAPP